jgi:hypothetical protein
LLGRQAWEAYEVCLLRILFRDWGEIIPYSRKKILWSYMEEREEAGADLQENKYT